MKIDFIGTSATKGTMLNDGSLHGTSMVVTKNSFDVLDGLKGKCCGEN